MAFSSEARQRTLIPVAGEALRECLLSLGWSIDLVDVGSIIARQKCSPHEYSAVIAWTEGNEVVNIKVQEIGKDRAGKACEKQLSILLAAIKATFGNIQAVLAEKEVEF